MNGSEPKTIHVLVGETGVSRQSLSKWLLQDGIAPVSYKGKSGLYDPEKVNECVAKHRNGSANGESDPEKIDPKTGLSWFQAKLREDTIRLRRENEEEEALKSERWMSTDKHHEILRILCTKIEQLPGKMKSELGLTAQQSERARQMLDEARQLAAGQVSAIPEEAA